MEPFLTPRLVICPGFEHCAYVKAGEADQRHKSTKSKRTEFTFSERTENVSQAWSYETLSLETTHIKTVNGISASSYCSL